MHDLGIHHLWKPPFMHIAQKNLETLEGPSRSSGFKAGRMLASHHGHLITWCYGEWLTNCHHGIVGRQNQITYYGVQVYCFLLFLRFGYQNIRDFSVPILERNFQLVSYIYIYKLFRWHHTCLLARSCEAYWLRLAQGCWPSILQNLQLQMKLCCIGQCQSMLSSPYVIHQNCRQVAAAGSQRT